MYPFETNKHIMRVSIFQYDIAWLDPAANLSKIEEVCAQLSGKTDLLVLPEMFNTGFIMQTQDLVTNWQDDTIQKLSTFSAEYGMTISGSIPMYRDGQYFNTFIVVNAIGVVAKYDKIHLFSMAGESDHYESGHQTVQFHFDNFLVQPLICYDLRFPYLSYTETPADVLIYTANWPTTRISHWKSLLIARAIENQCYVIGVNRTGSDHNGYIYPGSSMIVDYNGDILVEMQESPAFTTYDLYISKMNSFRENLPFLKDRNKGFLKG